MKTSSPCINLCQYIILDNVPTCSGCGRTYDDLEHWMTMSRDEKVKCVKRCKDNLKKLAKI